MTTSRASAVTTSRARGASFTLTDDGIVMRDNDKRVASGGSIPKRRLSRAHSAASSPPGSPRSLPFDALLSTVPSPSTAQTTTTSVNVSASFYRPGRRLDEKRADEASSSSSSLAPPLYTPLAIQKDQPRMLFGIELKWISLVTLSLQNAFLTIIMHYSRISTPPSRTYSAATAVLLNELLKCTISTFIALKRIDNSLWESQRLPEGHSRGFTLFHRTRLAALRRNIFSSDCYKLAVPAILYVVQNNLQYVAVSNLDVATFQVTYQMKILTTAFFSVLILGKRLSRGKWGALILLAIGVGIVQIQAVSNAAPADAHLFERVMHPLRGFLAVTFACLTSGIAGVYFEFLVKSEGATDLWTRNTQLSLFSIIPALIPVLLSPHPGMTWTEGVASRFSNFNGWALGTVLTQTFGGLVTAIVMKYSDNIMKGFATSLSIVLSFLASVALFNYTLSIGFVLGASTVLAATWVYNSPTPERISVAVAPGSPIPSSAVILGEPDAVSRSASFVSLLTGKSRTSFDLSIPPSPLPPPLSRGHSFQGGSTPTTPYLSSAGSSHLSLHEMRK